MSRRFTAAGGGRRGARSRLPSASPLVGEYYTDIGYNAGTHAWADQSGRGNNLTVVGTPTINAGALNGYPSITLTTGKYHRNLAFSGFPVGSKPTFVVVTKPSAGAMANRDYVNIETGSRRDLLCRPNYAYALVSSDFTSGAQGLTGIRCLDSRSDRFNILISNGDLTTYCNGRLLAEPAAPYTGITAAGTAVAFGRGFNTEGLKGEVVSYRAYSRALTQSEINDLCLFYDAKYGLDTQTNDKWLAIMGQSNGELLIAQLTGDNPTFVRPRNSRLYGNSTSGASLIANGGDWGPTDPHGWRAQTAADYLAKGLGVARTAVIWSQGESDTPASAWTDAVVALIGNMDSRMGRSDTPWIIPRIHPSSTASGMRPFQDAVATAMPSRVYIVNTDDLTLADTQHYDAASHQTIWTRCLQAIDAHYGSSDWAG